MRSEIPKRAYWGLPIADRLRVLSRAGANGCVNFIGSRDRKGYGRLVAHGKVRFAHRVAYETARGPIPRGLVIDHLCRNHSCINPDHMEPVTIAENALRGEAPNVVAWRAGTCRKGHPLAGANLYMDTRGRRVCRRCNADAARRYQKRKRSA